MKESYQFAHLNETAYKQIQRLEESLGHQLGSPIVLVAYEHHPLQTKENKHA